MSRNKMVKVLQFAPGFLFGGVESRMLDWYRNIDRDEVHFDLLKQSNNSDFTSNIEQLKELGSNIFNIPQFKYYNVINYYRAINHFFKAHPGYEVVHSHSVTTGLFVLFYAKKYGIRKRVLHARTTRFDGNLFRRTLSRIMNYFARSYATDYFACSQKAGEFAFGKKNKFIVINNGIELDRFRLDYIQRDKMRKDLGLQDNFVVGSICRLTEPKNLPFVIDITMKLIKTEPTTKLLLVGDGPLNDYVKNRFVEANLSENLVLVGKKDNVWDYYFAMDVFLSPSLWEGFGTTVIEAQATGLPCIVSDNFPPSTEMSELMFRLSLSKPADFWMEKILNMKGLRNDQLMIRRIANAGFDAQEVANILEGFYKS
ncbi:MAG: glycosyltransferase [Dysgonomonas sp.]